MKNVIVTGANGFIGKNLISVLTKTGYTVIALDCAFDDEILNNKFVNCINVSDKRPTEIKSLIPDLEFYCLFHLAWRGTSGKLRQDYSVQLDNVKMACEYIELCATIGCRRIIYASSINEMETYEYLQSDNINPGGGYIYGTCKMAAHFIGETVAKSFSLEFIPVIITNIYGAGEMSSRLICSSICKLLRGEHCSFTTGEQDYDFIYITDAINSIVSVAERGLSYNRYYIGSGNPRPLRDYLTDMASIVAPDARLGFGEIEFNGKALSYSQFDMKKVQNDTGYVNKVSFSDGIKMTLDYLEGIQA